MKRRCWIVGALALFAGASGCSTMRQGDGPMTSRLKAWAEAPAPPQRQVALPPERDASSPETASTLGLSKYFPGLRRDPAPFPEAADARKAGWFSFARRSRPPAQQYTTDSRAGLNRGMGESGVLPVSLQMPTDRPADKAVTPARVESPAPAASAASRPADPGMAAAPARVADDEVNPLPPAAEPSAPVAARMPELPAIDPRERPRLASATDPASVRPDPATVEAPGKPEADDEVNPLPPAAEPAADSPAPTPAPAPAPTTREATPAEAGKGDDQAVKAIRDPADPAEPMVLAEFLHKMAAKVKAKKAGKHVHSTTVHASPQSEPKPTPQTPPPPKVVVKPTPQVVVKPTPQVVVKPTAQGVSSTVTCDSGTTCNHSAKKPCLRKLVRRMMGLGEFAAPPTAAP